MYDRTERRARAPMPAHGSLAGTRLVIEGVSPQIDCGRHAVKRVVGDTLIVEADVYKDGHDLLAARIAYRPDDERQWAYAPMRYDEPRDRWSGSFRLERVGRWRYTVEAWVDVFATWRSELAKKRAAGYDVASELAEGAALAAATAPRAKGVARSRFLEAAAVLRNEGIDAEHRIEVALSDELAIAMTESAERLITRHERELVVIVDRERAQFAAWYEMFPRSQGTVPARHGNFADAARRLPELARLGFDVVYLPPIHPIGHTRRKGPNNSLKATPRDVGSPWAIGDERGGHTAVHAELGTLDDFDRFVRTAHELGLEVALDYALQCSPDHPWLREHPDWFLVRPDGSIKHA
ncbi:MAG TPA: maltotransferase domain-containing protein, partial [Candidatus Binatia bacterium]|nr:maltotransferase domain-containing protein [Candidatus Binatia bacterium]